MQFKTDEIRVLCGDEKGIKADRIRSIRSKLKMHGMLTTEGFLTKRGMALVKKSTPSCQPLVYAAIPEVEAVIFDSCDYDDDQESVTKVVL